MNLENFEEITANQVELITKLTEEELAQKLHNYVSSELDCTCTIRIIRSYHFKNFMGSKSKSYVGSIKDFANNNKDLMTKVKQFITYDENHSITGEHYRATRDGSNPELLKIVADRLTQIIGEISAS